VRLSGASQSSPYGNNAYPASNAFRGKKFTHTNKGVGMWWSAQLNGDYTIRKIAIKNRGDCCGQRLAKTQVLVSG
jgi:hypothetical protein